MIVAQEICLHIIEARQLLQSKAALSSIICLITIPQGNNLQVWRLIWTTQICQSKQPKGVFLEIALPLTLTLTRCLL